MQFKVKSTRHTAVGTFRAGVVYAADMTSKDKAERARADIVQHHIAAGAFVEVTEAAGVTAQAAGVQAAGPDNGGAGVSIAPEGAGAAEPVVEPAQAAEKQAAKK